MILTYGVKYIGSKKKLNDYIIKMVTEECADVKSVIDVFTGTTRVAQALRQQNLPVITSDLSWASEAYAYAYVHNSDNRYLQQMLDYLNNLAPKDGWLTENYCDVLSRDGTGNIVRVWQPKNGRKADAIRDEIEKISHGLDYWEKMTLITSLIHALDAVDNTVGVQQAYLKHWCARSYNDLELVLPPLLWTGEEELPKGQHFVGDALKIEYPDADLAYIDPPYSPHSYATYYHIWDSITRWDKPEVSLKTNRRIDRTSQSETFKNEFGSPWNIKKDALGAFRDLIDRLPTKYCLISYSNDSLVSIEDLITLCESKGTVITDVIDYDRNIMCKIGNHSGTEYITKNKELLILIKRW